MSTGQCALWASLDRRFRRRRLRLALEFLIPARRSRSTPAVTIYVPTFNTRYPLELTLRTMIRTTRYPNYKIIVLDDNSDDDTVDFVRSLPEEAGIGLVRKCELKNSTPFWHTQIVEMAQAENPKYWMHVDSDMVFLGRDWLWDMVTVMEERPDIDLLAGEHVEPGERYREPVGEHREFDLGERFGTWIYMVRTSLHERFASSMAPVIINWGGTDGRDLFYDSGGQYLMDLRAAGHGYAAMPLSFRRKFHHWANMAWTPQYGGEHLLNTKRAEKEYIKRWLVRLRGSGNRWP